MDLVLKGFLWLSLALGAVQLINNPQNGIRFLGLITQQTAEARSLTAQKNKSFQLNSINSSPNRKAEPNEKWARTTDKKESKWRVIGPKSESSEVKPNPVSQDVVALNPEPSKSIKETVHEKLAQYNWKAPMLDLRDPANAWMLQVSQILSVISMAVGMLCLAWLAHLCFSTSVFWGIGAIIFPILGTIFCIFNFETSRNLVLLMFVSFVVHYAVIYLVAPQLAFTMLLGYL